MALMTTCEAGGTCQWLSSVWADQFSPDSSVEGRKGYCAQLVASLIENGQEALVDESDCGYEAQFKASQNVLEAHFEGVRNA